MAIVVLSTAGVALQAANIFTVTGPAPFSIVGEIVDVISFEQTSTYANVTITMPFTDRTLSGPISGVQGTAYLTNQIGPGTTVANQIAGPVSISGLGNTFSTRTLFTGLTLTPGIYYVVLLRTTSKSLAVEGSSTPTVTPGAGVSDRGDGIAFTAASYAPASTFTPSPLLQTPTNDFITVTGDPAPTPTPTPIPSTLILLLTGLAGVGLFTARRKFTSRGELVQ